MDQTIDEGQNAKIQKESKKLPERTKEHSQTDTGNATAGTHTCRKT